MQTHIADLLASAEQSDRQDAHGLFEALYAELHRLARAQLARNGGGVTLGVTTLLHEAYLDISQRASVSFVDRGRFMAYAAKVMRGLIVDHARHRGAQKRGTGFEITSFDEGSAGEPVNDTTLEHIGAAVEELAAVDAALAEVVDLKFFCGFSFEEIAAMRDVSERTVRRSWEKARLYLHRSIQASGRG